MWAHHDVKGEREFLAKVEGAFPGSAGWQLVIGSQKSEGIPVNLNVVWVLCSEPKG